MGLTTSLRPFDDCTKAQTACLEAPNGNGPDGEPEVSDNILRLVEFYTRNLAVPARRDVGAPQVLAGKNLFYKAGCVACSRLRAKAWPPRHCRYPRSRWC